jgi:DNA-binding protein HU-beta
VRTSGEAVDAVLEEIYEALKRGECVSLKNFGTFYVRPERECWVFKFNPAQRLRKLFGWSSTYTGDL